MAFYDWNHDGKKDFTDDFIEYNIYKESTKNSTHSSSRGGEISTLGAVLSVIAGLIGQVMLYMMLGAEIEDVPAIVILVWEKAEKCNGTGQMIAIANRNVNFR